MIELQITDDDDLGLNTVQSVELEVEEVTESEVSPTESLVRMFFYFLKFNLCFYCTLDSVKKGKRKRPHNG